MQYEFTSPASVLDERGRVKQPGYGKQPLLEYRRNQIKASKWRIKEWDYYAVLNSEFGISMTIADLSYSAMITVVFFDFQKKTVERKTKLLWFTSGIFAEWRRILSRQRVRVDVYSSQRRARSVGIGRALSGKRHAPRRFDRS